MEKAYKESSSNFSFEFGGEDGICAETLTKTIDNIVNSLQYITTKENPEAYVKLKISSFRPGSFNIDLQAIVGYIPTLLTKENIEIAGIIVTMLVSAFEIKKHLKGEKPKEVTYNKDEATIINSNDEKLVMEKRLGKIYFENEIIDANIVNIFNIIRDDCGRSNLRIKQDNADKLKIEREEFEIMSRRIVEVEEEKDIETISQTIDVELPLRKPDLLGNSQWGFVYIKNINATIKDEEWLENVHLGQIKNLYAGVKIPVRLLIEYDLDKYKNPIKDSDRYTILKILGEIKEPEPDNQIKLI